MLTTRSRRAQNAVIRRPPDYCPPGRRGSCGSRRRTPRTPYLAGDLAVPGYDPDLLSRARYYNDVSLAGALWSLRWAVDAWTQSAEAALARGVVLQHATRGTQRAEDVARNNAHDAHHHLWDIDRTLRAG